VTETTAAYTSINALRCIRRASGLVLTPISEIGASCIALLERSTNLDETSGVRIQEIASQRRLESTVIDWG